MRNLLWAITIVLLIVVMFYAFQLLVLIAVGTVIYFTLTAVTKFNNELKEVQ